MENRRVLGIALAIMLLSGGLGIFPRASAQEGEGASPPTITDKGNYTEITTDDFTVIFPSDNPRPFFVWWDNNDTSKVYVVHFKGLIEYAQINGSSFSLTNAAGEMLWERMIQTANALDLAMSESQAKVFSAAFETHSRLILASTKVMLPRAALPEVKIMLQQEVENLERLREGQTDPDLISQIDATIAAINEAIYAIDSGADRSAIKSAISNAKEECQRLTKTISEKNRAMIGDMIEQRKELKGIAQGFHPALLAFGGCKWNLSEASNIIAPDGKVIGITFNMTLTEAQPKFDFTEGKVKLAVRIYNAPVTETVTIGDGAQSESYSYDVAAGEMKIDLVIEGWDWNFDPKTVALLNTDIAISPALALWIDASSFQVNGNVEDETLFNDLEDVKMQVGSEVITLNVDDTNVTMGVTDQNQDAEDLDFKFKLAHRRIAGKLMKFPAPAKLKLSEEGTIGGFFKFVPVAAVTNSTGDETKVNVTAAYLSAGNHVKMYLCYPYFNGTLTHDPSLGVESASEDAKYIVTLSATGSVITAIQEVPTMPAWGSPYGLLAASGLVFVAAVALIFVVRRHPAVV